jgi:RNA-directed DNA polymerase
MQTSLQGIAHKAAQDKTYRFRNLVGLLTITNLLWCWSKLNRRAAPGIDRMTARMYRQDLVGHVTALVGRVKAGIYRARLIPRRYIPKGEGKWRP